MKKQTIYTDKDYLDEQFNQIKSIIAPLKEDVADLKTHKSKVEGFMSGAKLAFIFAVSLVSLGFIKVGLGSEFAEAVKEAVKE